MSKLWRSGYKAERIHDIVESGLVGYYRMVMKEEQGGERVNKPAHHGQAARDRRKVVGKATWMKVKAKVVETKVEGAESATGTGGHAPPPGSKVDRVEETKVGRAESATGTGGHASPPGSKAQPPATTTTTTEKKGVTPPAGDLPLGLNCPAPARGVKGASRKEKKRKENKAKLAKSRKESREEARMKSRQLMMTKEDGVMKSRSPKQVKKTTSGPKQLLIDSFLLSRPRGQGDKGGATSKRTEEAHEVARGYSAQEEEVPPGEEELPDECHVQAQALTQDQAQVDQGAIV